VPGGWAGTELRAKEAVRVITKTTNEPGWPASERLPGIGEAELDAGLRALAIERIYRARRFKLQLVVLDP
jgi:hypothetical protein